MGVRSQLSWLVKGRAATQSTLESLTGPAGPAAQGRRTCSHQVAAIETRQLDEFDKLRDCGCRCHRRPDGQGRRAATADRQVVTSADETPAERIARWTAADAAVGLAAENDQLRAQLVDRAGEVADLRARLAQLTNRVAQLEAENAELRRRANRVPLATFAHRAYRKARSALAGRRPR